MVRQPALESAEPDGGQRPFDAGLDLLRRDAHMERPEGHVLEDCRGNEMVIRVLEGKPDLRSDAPEVLFCYAYARNCYGSVRWRLDAIEVEREVPLPAPVGPAMQASTVEGKVGVGQDAQTVATPVMPSGSGRRSNDPAQRPGHQADGPPTQRINGSRSGRIPPECERYKNPRNRLNTAATAPAPT